AQRSHRGVAICRRSPDARAGNAHCAIAHAMHGKIAQVDGSSLRCGQSCSIGRHQCFSPLAFGWSFSRLWCECNLCMRDVAGRWGPAHAPCEKHEQDRTFAEPGGLAGYTVTSQPFSYSRPQYFMASGSLRMCAFSVLRCSLRPTNQAMLEISNMVTLTLATGMGECNSSCPRMAAMKLAKCASVIES